MDPEGRTTNAREPLSPDSPQGEPLSGGAAGANPHDGHDLQQLLALARNPPPGASVYSPEAAVSNAVNPRSCVTCRRRKVRCDKHMPCSNCRRAKIPCIFPAPGRAPRRARPKDPNAPPKQGSSERELELMKRLRKLEGIVEELSGQIEVEGSGRHSSSGASPENATAPDVETVERPISPTGSGGRGSPAAGAHRGAGACPPTGQSRKPDVRNFGRLVHNDKGFTRYVSNAFWSKINDELDDLRRATQRLSDEESDDSDHDTSPESAILQDNKLSNHQSFVMGYRSADIDLRPLHPLPSLIPFMWQTFQENVDPVVRILHVPTTDKMVREAQNDLDSLTPSTEALLFSIYYAAITSMTDEDVKKNFGSSKDFLVSQYRFSLEQALAKANFMTAADLTVIQALLLFLILVRHHDDTRFVWTMTGLLVRISTAIGLHRDGTNFPNLTPFEIEMRRRVFWHLTVLDLRSAEDHGSDLILIERSYDTEMPLNINDSDISPESKELPKPRKGPTDMAFALIRYEICILARRLYTSSSALARVCPNDASRSLEEKEAMISEWWNRLEHRYLKEGNALEHPIIWTAANIARVVVGKMTLVIYQPLLLPGPGGEEKLPKDARERVFRAAIDVFEYNHLLNTDSRSKPWRWLIQTYTQWHAVAYVLIEVSQRPWSSVVERAWVALNSVFAMPKPQDVTQMAGNIGVWLPIRKLYLKARKHRDAEIARLQADPAAAQQLDLDEQAKSAPTATFGSLPGAVKSAVAHERWRKLVNAPAPAPGTRPANFSTRMEIPPIQALGISDEAPQREAPLAQAEVMDEHIMNFVSETMANRDVVPSDFYPAIWTMASEYPGGANPMLGLATPGSIPAVDNGAMQAPAQPGRSNGGYAGAPPMYSVDNNPPPWLWPAAGVPGPAQAQFTSRSADDADVNMEENFNWQGLQEDLSKFSMPGAGTSGGPWGSGF